MNAIPSRSLHCILAHAAAVNFVTPERLTGRDRGDRAALDARRAAALVAWDHGHSTGAIGRMLGGRDHTTAMAARDWASIAAQADPAGAFAAMLARLRKAVRQYPLAMGPCPAHLLPPPSLPADAGPDDVDALARMRGTIALAAALRAQHPERMCV